jgi:hypothetical protein
MAQEPADYYRGLTALYNEAIRASDIKANIVLFFLSIVMGTIVGVRDQLPHFLPVPIALSPFLVVFLALFIALLPRYPSRGRESFRVLRTASPADFQVIENADREGARLRLTCATLSHILFWKTACLRISFFICLVSIVVSALLVIVYSR